MVGLLEHMLGLQCLTLLQNCLADGLGSSFGTIDHLFDSIAECHSDLRMVVISSSLHVVIW